MWDMGVENFCFGRGGEGEGGRGLERIGKEGKGATHDVREIGAAFHDATQSTADHTHQISLAIVLALLDHVVSVSSCPTRRQRKNERPVQRRGEGRGRTVRSVF